MRTAEHSLAICAWILFSLCFVETLKLKIVGSLLPVGESERYQREKMEERSIFLMPTFMA